MARWVFFNQEYIPEEKALLHFRDLSIQRGYGIFDFFKVISSHAIFLEEHLDRFYHGAREMRLPLGYSREELQTIIYELLAKNGVVDTGVRITLTGGYSPDGFVLASPNLVISIHPFRAPTDIQRQQGISLMTYPHQRQLPHIKSIDYLMGIWLQELIRQNGADDVLYHQNGVVTECPRSNFFIVDAEGIIRTPAHNQLNGIMRMKLLEIAKDDLEIIEDDLTIDQIRKAREAFITSTTKTILPVARIDSHIFPGDKALTNLLYHRLAALESNEAGSASLSGHC